MIERIRRQTLSSKVVDHLLGYIKSGQVKPGDRLPTEKQLTEQLGVSRTCVREAMKSLESLHLIDVRPKIGAVVQDPSVAALFHSEHLATAANLQETDVLVEFRKILEVGLASLAAAKADLKDLADMEKALEDHQRALKSGAAAYPADIAFHMAIANASKNPIAVLVLQMISGPLTEQRKRIHTVPGAVAISVEEHREIFAAIQARDPEKARSAMHIHMEGVERSWRVAKAQDLLEHAAHGLNQPMPSHLPA